MKCVLFGVFVRRGMIYFLPADSFPTTNVNGFGRWAAGAFKALRAVVRNAWSVALDMISCLGVFFFFLIVGVGYKWEKFGDRVFLIINMLIAGLDL